MRLARTTTLIAALLAVPAVFADTEGQASVADIQRQISSVEGQYEEAQRNRIGMQEQINDLRSRLAAAREQSAVVEQERRQALERMNRRYRELVDDPNTDISEAQQGYQQSVVNAQRNANQIGELSAELSNVEAQAERLRVREHGLVNQLERYQEGLALARVDRLVDEFSATSQVQVEQEVTCERDETLGQCESRADLLAKQRASRSYLDRAFNQLSESELANKNREHVSPDVRLLGSRPLSSGYSGQRSYSVNLEINLQGRIARRDVCTLLELDTRYCADNVQAASEEARDRGKKPTDEDVLHRVIIRSNVFDDQVTINGERYGSTPVEVMLKADEYDVVVSRRGYTTHNERISVRRSATYRAVLEQLAFDFSPGEIIQDALGEDAEGPSLVVIPSGRQRLGERSADQREVRHFELDIPLAVSVFPVTVSDFRRFINDSGYVTTAEQGESCNSLDNGTVTSNRNLSWESPGYSVADNLPVTCVSYQDAQRYVSWLSRKTGQRYRLVSEDEWEYAARAGTNTAYWWGDSIGSGRANCFTCGTRWSGSSPSPAGTFSKNPFGLEDTVGNVWEWTVPGRATSAPIARGGAFNFAPALARSSSRMELYTRFSANYVGFRVVRQES